MHFSLLHRDQLDHKDVLDQMVMQVMSDPLENQAHLVKQEHVAEVDKTDTQDHQVHLDLLDFQERHRHLKDSEVSSPTLKLALWRRDQVMVMDMDTTTTCTTKERLLTNKTQRPR